MSEHEENAQDEDDAVAAEVRVAAHAGDIEAQALYAQMLCEGRGVAADAQEGLHWYALAANSGHAGAMNMLGRCHELGHGTPVDLERAVAWYRKAAGAGLDWGMYNFAQLLASGRGVTRDRAQAFALYRRAAEAGHAKSMNLVGRYYDEGWEVERDAAIAHEWYRRAALGGDFRGQTSYASLLAQAGRIDAAVHWLRRAATTATPAFLERLAADLANSPHALLREVAAELRQRASAAS
jgi:TPR repeat protein